MNGQFSFLITMIGLLNVTVIINGEKTALFCADYLACRSRISSIHHKCNERARQITGESCSLNDSFWELQMLLKERETDLAICIGRESLLTDKEENNGIELPVAKCRTSGRTTLEEISSKATGCRQAIANIKMRCDQIKLCCPAARHCERILTRMPITNEVKQKHTQISRRTIECRTKLRNILSVNNNTEKFLRARAYTIVTSKLEDIVTEWPNDITNDNVLSKFHNTTIIRTNSLYPLSSADTNESTRKSRRKKIVENLSKRYDQFATFLDRLMAILLEQKMKRKALTKLSTKKLKMVGDSTSDANLESSSAKLSSFHKPTTMGDPTDNLDDQRSIDASRLLSNSFENVKNSYHSTDFHRNSESADTNVSGEELSKLPDSGSSDRKFESVFLFKHPSAASLHLSFIQQSPDQSDSTAAAADRQEVTRNDEEDNPGFSGRKNLRQPSEWTDPTHLTASAYKKHTTLKNQPHGTSDTVEDGISDFRNAPVDRPASVIRSQEDDDKSDSSEEILDGGIEAVLVVNEDNTDSSTPFQKPAESREPQSSFYKSRMTTTNNSSETMKSTIADAMTIANTSFAHRSELEAKPVDEKIAFGSPIIRIKKLHRAEGVVTGVSPAEDAVIRLNNYHKTRTTISDTNRSFINGEENEFNEEHQHDQTLWKSKRHRGDMISNKSRLHSQTIFEGNDELATKLKDPLKNGITKKIHPSITVNNDDDNIALLATITSNDAYVDDNGLWTMSPPNTIIKEDDEGNAFAEVRTHSQSGQVIEDVHIRHSPIVAFNKGPSAYPEVRGMHHTEANRYWHPPIPGSNGKLLGIKEPLGTIYGEITTPNMEYFENTMQHMQRTTTQETTMPSTGNMRMSEQQETQSAIKTLKKNEQNNRMRFFNLKISKINNDLDENKLKVDLLKDLGEQKKFITTHSMINNSMNSASNSWPPLKAPNKKMLTHLSEIRRRPTSDSFDELPTVESTADVGGSKRGDEDIKQHRIADSNSNHIKTLSNRQELLRQIYTNIDKKGEHSNKNLVWLLPWSKDITKSDHIPESFSTTKFSENNQSEKDGIAPKVSEHNSTLSIPISTFEKTEQSILNATVGGNTKGYGTSEADEKENSYVDFEMIERLLILRRPKLSYMMGEEIPGYCALYAACSKQLKHEQRACMPTSTAGRLIPGLPRRRTGICNQLLVADFQALDVLTLRVEQMIDDCVDEAVKEEYQISNKFNSSRCTNNWPLLPYYYDDYTCLQRMRVVQLHCGKLMTCCQQAQRCRRQVDESELTIQLNGLKNEVLTKSAACQIQSYKEYEKKHKKTNQRDAERII